MCNNIEANKLTKKEEIKKKSLEIKDKVFYDRGITPKNVLARALKSFENGKIKYRKGHPLKLGDGSRVYEVYSVARGEMREFFVLYTYRDKTKKETTSFLRRKKDSALDVEEFLAYAFSVYELRNIDLRYD